MEIVSVVVAQQEITSFSDNFNNKFFKMMEEKFYDSVMLEPQVKDAFKYIIGAPIVSHNNNMEKGTLTLALVIEMNPEHATYWKLKHT